MITSYSSIGDTRSKTIKSDVHKMAIGYVLMFIYAMFVLGRTNFVENRMYLAAAGILSVILGLLMAVGISMAFGLKFSRLLGVLPFLAMGIFFSQFIHNIVIQKIFQELA